MQRWRIEFDYQEGDDPAYLRACEKAAAGGAWATQASALRAGNRILAKVRLYEFGGAKVPLLQLRPKPVEPRPVEALASPEEPARTTLDITVKAHRQVLSVLKATARAKCNRSICGSVCKCDPCMAREAMAELEPDWRA